MQLSDPEPRSDFCALSIERFFEKSLNKAHLNCQSPEGWTSALFALQQCVNGLYLLHI
jgi:hypothetical protein